MRMLWLWGLGLAVLSAAVSAADGVLCDYSLPDTDEVDAAYSRSIRAAAPAITEAAQNSPELPQGDVTVLYGSLGFAQKQSSAQQWNVSSSTVKTGVKGFMMSLVENTERYGEAVRNPVQRVADEPVSTFGIDVDTGSYANVRRLLREGRLPPRGAVRIEEMVNYFPYARIKPQGDAPLALDVKVVDSPWQTAAKLMRIRLDSEAVADAALPAANLVFLVDVSGSMQEKDKLPLVQTTLCLLTQRLRPEDTVSIVTYASGEKLALPATSGAERDKIMRVIDGLRAGGATDGESAIQMAYREAEKSFKPDGINRILLATDGDFNVGITDFDALKSLAANKRKTGVALTTLGFGGGNYNEHLMEQLADAGDGNYSYIDGRKEAEKVLQQALSATLFTVAKDVKIQVEFNPATVSEYRLVGYDNRLLNEEDFNNDAVDAGEVGAGHQVTALYEFVPVGVQGWLDARRYADKPTEANGANDAEYAFVKLRYRLPDADQSTLLTVPVPVASTPLYQADADTRFAIAVAGFAQLLRDDALTGQWSFADVLRTAQAASDNKVDTLGLRRQFIELVQQAEGLTGAH